MKPFLFILLILIAGPAQAADSGARYTRPVKNYERQPVNYLKPNQIKYIREIKNYSRVLRDYRRIR